ncbi:hypothetical protein MAPG_02278 [Magnaporthiopsis poae ATCC 64411]|uniref:C2H2-type domain-containing protein n=1 Tax=Magnaporthiopsis poae (strain ATCC 64411 / 73-15) TaxID=644358 RepID=A0A0C4DQY0_MAGP6|nr:hypothetical protein MAPG_02278 [Magnaporthiopsis poae ATCC 64411]
MMDTPAGFAARRPGSTPGLPSFTDLSSTRSPEIPRAATDALSPLSSGINSASSQSSQTTTSSHTAGPPFYPPAAGSWPAPGSSSGYTLSSIASQNQSQSQNQNQSQPGSLMQSSSSYNSNGGGPRSQNYSPGVQYGSFRNSQQPSSGADSVSIPSYPADQLPPFAPSLGSGGGANSLAPPPALPSQQSSHSILGSHSQALPPVSSASSSDQFRQGSFAYPPTSGPAPPSFPAFATHSSPPSHASPTTSAGMSRGIPSMGHSGGMMHPNLAYSSGPRPPGHHQHYSSYAHMGTVMSNVANPSQSMPMIPPPGVYPMAQHHHQHMYHQHADPAAARLQDRPFRCDQCNQSFNRNHDLKRHKRIHLAVKPFPCTHCDKSFSRKDALKRHRLVKGCGGKTAEDGSTTQAGSDGAKVKPEDARSDSDGTAPSPPRQQQARGG